MIKEKTIQIHSIQHNTNKSKENGMKKLLSFILLVLAGSVSGQFTDNFNRGTVENWTRKTPARWTAGLEQGRMAFYINTGNYSHEAPGRLGEYALVNNRVWSDFSFSCLARSMEDYSENPSADFAVVFGHQDNANYYYMLFNRWAGETKLFKIVAGERTEIAASSDFYLQDNEYHTVGIRRSGVAITVTCNGALVLTARDGTFSEGRIGLGSFNDAAAFDDVRIEETPVDLNRWVRATSIAGPWSVGTSDEAKSQPAIAVAPGGVFVLAWVQFRENDYSLGQPYSCHDIMAQVFAQNGSPLTAPIQVSAGLNALNPQISAKDGRFFISWFDIPDFLAVVDGPRSLVGKHFSCQGEPLSETLTFASESENYLGAGIGGYASVVYTQENTIAAVWLERFILNGYDVYSSLDGRINDLDGAASDPVASADDEGRCLIAWNQGAVYVQAFTSGGSRVGSNMHVNPSQILNASSSTAASNRFGQALIAWTLDNNVYGRRCSTAGTWGGAEFLIFENADHPHVSVNRRGDALATARSNEGLRARFMQNNGAWSAVQSNIRMGVFWENRLYSMHPNPDGTSITAAVYVLDNHPMNYAPHLVSARSDTAREDTPYTYTPGAFDPNGDAVTFSFVEYPGWLTPDGTGLSGTPRQGDTDTVLSVIVSDGMLSDTAGISLTVIPVDDPPWFVSPDTAIAYKDSLFTYTARAVDEEDSLLLYAFTEFPSWMTPADSMISGIVPNDAQDTSFTVTVSDGLWTEALNVRVSAASVNASPFIMNLPDFEFPNTETYAILLDTCVIDDDPAEQLTWTVRPQNDSLLVSLEDRLALFSAQAWAGTTAVLFRVSDPQGASDSVSVTATVNTAGRVPPGRQGIPTDYRLSPVYPNPFNASTLISFDLPAASVCRLVVYNLKGECIEHLYSGRKEAGNHSLMWDARDCPSGTYLIRLKTEGFDRTRKCTLIK